MKLIKKRLFLIAVCAIISFKSGGGETELFAQDQGRVLKEMFQGMRERVEPASVKWEVLREIMPNEEKAQVYINDEAKRQNPNATKVNQLVEKAREGERIPITIELLFEHSDKYSVKQVFGYKSGNVEYGYYAHDDGVIYGVNELVKRIRLLSPQKVDILSELARGFPEMGCANYLKDLDSIRFIGEKDGLSRFESEADFGMVTSIAFEMKTKQIVSLELNAVGSEGAKIPVFYCHSSIHDPSTTVPQKVEYEWFDGKGKIKMRETWVLKGISKLERNIDEDTLYKVKPRFHIYDEMGPVVRKFLSDEILKPKR